jgi:signal transduction histidine kinase/GAF domain-containing protein/ActR/RegA family two-component response regulator
LYVTFLLGWLFASGMIVVAVTTGAHDNRSMTTAWFFVAGTGVLVVAFVTRDLSARRETNRLLSEREALIASMGAITDPRLTQLPLYRLLDELLGRARTVLRVETSSVFLLDLASNRLERTATSGFSGGPLTLAMGEGVIGRVAATRRGLSVPDAPDDRSVPPGIVSLLLAPIIAEGNLLGVLQLGTRERRQFSDNELRLLQMVVDRAAGAIEGTRLERQAIRSRLAADGARRRLALLADAGAVLGATFDDVGALGQHLGDALVPEFLDFFAFHRVEGDTLHPLAWSAGPTVAMTPDLGGDWTVAATEATTSGIPEVAWGADLEDDRWEAARARQLTSVVVVPVLAADFHGAMTFGTAGDRRGFRPGDVATLVDLAGRVAVAVERVLLGIETQQSAVRAARNATQLQRLTQAAFAVNAALDTSALAVVMSEQAARVFEAVAARVELVDEHGARQPVAEHGTPTRRAHVASAALTDAEGSSIGRVSVWRDGSPFTADENAVLRSLAQTASIALANARLYGTVHDSETRLRALYDASPVAIVEVDVSGRAGRWNRAAEALFGWPPYEDKLSGSVLTPLVAREAVADALLDAAPISLDVTLGIVEAELVAVPLRERDGTTRGAVVAAVDITERKHVAEQLQQAQRMEAMGRMAGGIAHDFNNVLMVITGYADLLLRRSFDDDVRSDIEAMRAAAKRAAEFTRKLLTISRRQMVQAQVVDVADALSSLGDVLPVMLGEHVNLDIRIDAPPPVLIDPLQLEQLVLNLAINAKDAMSSGGSLTIRAQGIDDDGAWTQLTVTDTGEGMDPTTVEHCFEPFFTTKDRTKGTGLGLSTAYGVVTQAGGEITVESARGVGTTFTIRLPAAVDHDELDAPPVRRSTAEPLHVLVVDDDEDVRSIVADMLELEGHDVRVASDGRAALRALEKGAPDVLLTDVVMPGMRGTDLAKEVRARHPKVRIVLMSSHVDDELAVHEEIEGALFLGKPFSPGALADVLTHATAKRARGRAGR